MTSSHALSNAPAWEAETKWGWSTDRDAERWYGSHATRDSAVEEAREELGDDREFFVRSGRAPDPAECMPCTLVGDILDRVAENAAEWGEIAEDWPDPPPREAEAELEDFVRAWLRKHHRPVFWVAYGAVERVAALRVGEDKP
jgi:hypothetical protein